MSLDHGKNKSDSHREKQYFRRRMTFTEECANGGRRELSATVPVFENLNDGDHGHYTDQDGDCRVVGKHHLTGGQKSASQNPRWSCGICKDEANEPTTSQCGHIFCRECIDKELEERSGCPICNSSFENKIRLKENNKAFVTFEDTLCECRRKKKHFLTVGLTKSARFLKKKVIYAGGSLIDMGNAIKQKTFEMANKPEYIVAFSVVMVFFLLFSFGFLPKIRMGEFIVDLLDFIKNYKFLEQPAESKLNNSQLVQQHKTIVEDRLPCTVGYVPADHIGNRCDSDDNIFKTFLAFIGLA